MKKFLLIPGIILVIVFAVIYAVNWDFIASIIPGWNTTIYPIWFFPLILVILILIIVSIIKTCKIVLEAIKRK